MPSPLDHAAVSERSTASSSRRRFLAAIGSAGVAGIAGCLAGGPDRVRTEVIEKRQERIVWQFPKSAGGGEGIGQVALSFDETTVFAERTPVERFVFTATVTGPDTRAPVRGFELERLTARIHAPKAYEREYGPAEFFVKTPGQWEDFSTYYDIPAGRREFVVDMSHIDTAGTIQVPLLLSHPTDPAPEALAITFSVQASRPGLTGRSVRAANGGRLAFGASSS